MKYISTFALICFLSIEHANCSDLFSDKELLSSAEMESTIIFLEDSQRISALTSQLRMVLDARRAVSPDTITATESVSLNLIQLYSRIKQRTIYMSENIRQNIISIPNQLSNLKNYFFKIEYSEALYSFFLILTIALIAGCSAGIVIWRFGRFLMKAAEKKDGTSQKIIGASSLFLIKSSFSFSLVIIGLVIAAIPTGFNLRDLIYEINKGIMVYIAIAGITHSIWNPAYRKYRISSISNEASAIIVRKILSFFRFSLLIFVIYQLSDRVWPAFAVFISGFYKIIIICWIFRMLSKYQKPVSQWFDSTARERKVLPKLAISVIKNLLLRMHYVSFVFLSGTTVLWFSGYKTLYMQTIVMTLRTAGIMLASLVLMTLWISILSRINRSVQKLASSYSDFKVFFSENVVTLRRFGLICIFAASLMVMMHFWGISIEKIFSSENLILKTTFHVIFILLGMFLIIQVSKLIIEKLKKEATARMLNSNRSSSLEIEKRVATLGNIVQKIAIGGILLFAIIMIMDELGFDIKAMLAGVGIVGLAVGFGAQNLVRDIISGLFLIFENRIRVGDVAIINGTGGLVEQVNLRTSILRSNDGTVHVFPNGAINSLSNMTHEFSYYVFDIGVCYNENLEKAMAVIKEVGDDIIKDPQFKNVILSPLEVLGVDSFGESAIIIKARIKTEPVKQWAVGREMNLRIKKSFDRAGIEMPFPHRTIYLGDSGKPLPLKIESATPDREEMKKLVREVMEETGRDLRL